MLVQESAAIGFEAKFGELFLIPDKPLAGA
jgi:hypothetical protein